MYPVTYLLHAWWHIRPPQSSSIYSCLPQLLALRLMSSTLLLSSLFPLYASKLFLVVLFLFPSSAHVIAMLLWLFLSCLRMWIYVDVYPAQSKCTGSRQFCCLQRNVCRLLHTKVDNLITNARSLVHVVQIVTKGLQPLLPITPAILPTTPKYFDWTVYLWCLEPFSFHGPKRLEIMRLEVLYFLSSCTQA